MNKSTFYSMNLIKVIKNDSKILNRLKIKKYLNKKNFQYIIHMYNTYTFCIHISDLVY